MELDILQIRLSDARAQYTCRLRVRQVALAEQFAHDHPFPVAATSAMSRVAIVGMGRSGATALPLIPGA